MILRSAAELFTGSRPRPGEAAPFAHNNYWMTNNAMELTPDRRTTQFLYD